MCCGIKYIYHTHLLSPCISCNKWLTNAAQRPLPPFPDIGSRTSHSIVLKSKQYVRIRLRVHKGDRRFLTRTWSIGDATFSLRIMAKIRTTRMLCCAAADESGRPSDRLRVRGKKESRALQIKPDNTQADSDSLSNVTCSNLYPL